MPYCAKCGMELPRGALFCPNCGTSIKVSAKAQVAKPRPRAAPSVPPAAGVAKSPRTAALLAAIVGFVAILGAGHFYIGRVKRGIAFLVPGIIFGILEGIAFVGYGTVGGAVGVFWMSFLIYLGLWIWQVLDAHKLAKRAS